MLATVPALTRLSPAVVNVTDCVLFVLPALFVRKVKAVVGKDCRPAVLDIGDDVYVLRHARNLTAYVAVPAAAAMISPAVNWILYVVPNPVFAVETAV